MAKAGFHLTLRNFEGPFDLLLQLIQDRKLDITDVALHEVTDEFIAYTRSLSEERGLDAVTEFIVVAATLLDLKTARLLPQGDMLFPEDLELLEARDLLFARLLQYKAYKAVADQFAQWQQNAPHRYPAAVSPDEALVKRLPHVELGVNVDEFALVAAVAFRPKPVPQVSTTHVHIPTVSVEQQARIVLRALSRFKLGESMSFGELTKDCSQHLTVVGRFLSLLDLYRIQTVEFSQKEPLGELFVEWTGKMLDDDQLSTAMGD